MSPEDGPRPDAEARRPRWAFDLPVWADVGARVLMGSACLTGLVLAVLVLRLPSSIFLRCAVALPAGILVIGVMAGVHWLLLRVSRPEPRREVARIAAATVFAAPLPVLVGAWLAHAWPGVAVEPLLVPRTLGAAAGALFGVAVLAAAVRTAAVRSAAGRSP